MRGNIFWSDTNGKDSSYSYSPQREAPVIVQAHALKQSVLFLKRLPLLLKSTVSPRQEALESGLHSAVQLSWFRHPWTIFLTYEIIALNPTCISRHTDTILPQNFIQN